jgi:uncharacterized protein (TIGR03435 family)
MPDRLRAAVKALCMLAMFWMGFAGMSLGAQSAPVRGQDWQKAAGGPMSFEVASIRPDPGPFRSPTFALSADDWFTEPNGRFHADFTLRTYIEFAYKLWLTGEEERTMLASLPTWVNTDRFSIETTAPLHATKDQYRLMMQSLLAERFKLTVHFENKEVSVLAMTLVKPGKPGPKLIPHEQGPACDEKPKPETYPSECYSFSANPKDGMTLAGSRGAPMELIGKFLGSVGGNAGEIGRPVVDQTGLTGRWDFTLQIAMPFGRPAPDAAAQEGPTILEAMQEQLGIKLKPAKATIPVLIVDHVERPSEN